MPSQSYAQRKQELENLKNSNQQKPEKEKKKKPLLIILIIFLILLLAAGGFTAWYFLANQQPKSQFEIDREALEGWLPGRTEAEIQAELNRIIDEGRFNVSINPTPVISNGKINVMVENVPANHYLMQVDVFLRNNDQDVKVYSSGIIKQGFHIESADVLQTLPTGEYSGYAVFHALQPETMEEIGQTEVTLLGKVE